MNLNDIKIENPALAVFVYRNTLDKSLDLVNRLEKTIAENNDNWKILNIIKKQQSRI